VPTLSRVLGKVKTSDLQKALGRWLASLVDSGRKRGRCAVASVDGKTSRSAGVHVLNVFLHDVRQVIWQAPVEAKKNEISALKEALSGLIATYPFLQILTEDAMFAGAPLCSDLIERGRHYVFQVKADQKHLYEKLELVFAPQLARDPAPDSVTGEKKRLRRRA
jgi:predicted transposase YbfD/YdcC